ncbi:MAG: phosphoglycolate phosphatase [Hyphomicrobiaceae bacterium]
MSEEPSAVRAIVFDLDGTLIDSAPDIHAAANRLMAELALPVFDLTTITSYIGNGIPKLVERCLAAAGDAGRKVDLHHAITRFKAFYAEEPALRTRTYPGVVEALEAFSVAGCRLGVVTNKAEDLSRAALADLGLARHFEVVIGGDTLETKKPDPEGLLLAVGRLGGSHVDALYVGDSEVDAETAARAGLRFALFTEGYRKSPVGALPHWHAFDDMRELLKHRAFAGATAARSL